MYKRMIILTYALVFFSLFATACSDNNNETYVEPILSQIEVSKLVTENNKTYVSVDGKPFPFLGAQIRLDALLNYDKMTINEVENYFKKAQELGLNCVQIPISWNMVEPKENKYDYSIVNSILQFVNKYPVSIFPVDITNLIRTTNIPSWLIFASVTALSGISSAATREPACIYRKRKKKLSPDIMNCSG